MATFWQDIRYAVRILLQRPGFTVLAVLMLALGIGTTTAIFSVVNSVLIRPFPYEEPDRLVVVWERQQQRSLPFMFASQPNYADWREQQTVFEEMAAFAPRGFFLKQGDESVRVMAARATSSLFSVLKVPPMLGGVFTTEHDQPGGGQVVVLSHRLWRDRFGGERDIVGRQIVLDDQNYTVLGVMPPEFKFPPPINLEGAGPDPGTDLWLPFATDMKAGQRGGHFMTVIARMKDGVAIEQADSEMKAIAARLAANFAETNAGWDTTIVPMSKQVLGETEPALVALLASVGCVLLIACVNVANLLLARGAARQKEFAIRLALGAGRGRLIRQVLTESLVLSLAGCAGGLALAWWGTDVLIGLAPRNVPRLEDTSVDARVVGFAIVISVVTGLLSGLAPALQSASLNLNQWLKEGGRSSGGRAAHSRLRGALVVAEVALSLVLLIGAGLLFQSFIKLRGIDAGFRAENVLTLRLALPQSKYPEPADRVSVYRELEQRLTALAGVESAGFTLDIPLATDIQGTSLLIEGQPAPPPGQERQTHFTYITPGYFTSMKVPVIEGRNFGAQDVAGNAEVAMVNQALARAYFPNESAIGKVVYIGSNVQTARRIVGVVADVRHDKLKEAPRPNVYLPFYQAPGSTSMSLALHAKGAPDEVLPAVRKEIRAVTGILPIFDVKPMDQVMSESLAQPRFSTLMLSVFSAVALVLAGIGIYGFISFLVAQSTHEIGVRMALGAQASNIFKLVIGKGLMLVICGLVIGVAAALALTRFISSLLFDVSATDTLTFLAVSVFLTAVALLACYFPARRATKVDPMIALRYE